MEKAISILAGNLNLGRSYLITTVFEMVVFVSLGKSNVGPTFINLGLFFTAYGLIKVSTFIKICKILMKKKSKNDVKINSRRYVYYFCHIFQALCFGIFGCYDGPHLIKKCMGITWKDKITCECWIFLKHHLAIIWCIKISYVLFTEKRLGQVWNPLFFHQKGVNPDIEGIICTWFGGTCMVWY